jgi:hypothetical protein
MASLTYSFANDKFKQSHEIIVIKIKESLNFVVKIINYREYIQFLNRLYKNSLRFSQTTLLSVNCPKPGYTCSKIEDIP